MGIQTGGNLVIPLVLWGKKCPKHTISAVAVSSNHNYVVTGSLEGQLCLWNFGGDGLSVTPKFMLYGHTGSITCIAEADHQKTYFASCSNVGELCLWDIQDGRCIESSKSGLIHTGMQAYQFASGRSMSLVCNGHYPEIHVINSESLEIIYSLVARVHPDWVNAVCVLKPVKRQDDIILAITKSGTIKMWSIDIHTVKSMHIYEDESKQIRCVDARAIRCCPYNQRTVLIVCSKYWQIWLANVERHSKEVYDAGEFSLLCNETSGTGTQWCGGEFIAIDKVIVWSDTGQAFLYKLPTNKLMNGKPQRPSRPPSTSGANAEHSDYHQFVGNKAIQHAAPSLYCVIDIKNNQFLEIPSLYVCHHQLNSSKYMLVRADADSKLHWWSLDDTPPPRNDDHIPTLFNIGSMSLEQLWAESTSVGLLDNVQAYLGSDSTVTSSLYIELSGRLICGLSDGQILIIPVVNTIRSLLLQPSKENKDKFPLHRVLHGHTARVNCLLYPHALETRYNPNYLLSGSSDFNVNLWDLSLGQLLHTFTVHAGEISQLYIPPSRCNSRVLSCVCSVASDHSVALLSLKDRRCLVFASRHMFPVVTIKWRPLEDYMIISCTDSTAYVWQMETGLLDRVVHGVTAVEMLKACEEASHRIALADNPTNPQVTVTQALKRRNLATFRNLAQQTIQQIENLSLFRAVSEIKIMAAVDEDDITVDTQETLMSVHTKPLMVQGLKTNCEDSETHIILFDTEALIVQLLCEEFGISSFEYFSGQNTQKKKSEIVQNVTDFFNMVKEKAEGISQLAVNSKAESLGLNLEPKGSGTGGSLSASPTVQRRRGSTDSSSSRDSDKMDRMDTLSLEISQLFLSLLHAWSLDKDLDELCLNRLGLERLKQEVSYGLISPNGQMVLMLPSAKSGVSNTLVRGYWEVSSALTTQHLLSVISLANTLMSMHNASFIKHKASKKQQNPPQQNGSGSHDSSADLQMKQSQIKQGWSLLAALHCILLPELVDKTSYQIPQLHLLANRWQDRCLEVREAAQALLLAELRRIGAEGRSKVIEEWTPHMPNLIDDSNGAIMLAEPEELGPSYDDDLPTVSKVNNERRRLEATAIVMLGVVGAEFGKEIDPKKTRRDSQKRSSMEGFSLSDHSLAWHTSKALAFLLLSPQQCKLSPYAPIRRAAIDLLGRGFSVWQPFIDVSAALLGLLEICIDADKILPSTQQGLPLTPAADACRTSRHALSLIATAQPATFLTCMAKEVARYNAAAQNPQSGTLQNSNVLIKAKSEILRIIELLIDKLPNDVADLLVETMDVAVHCLDPNNLKTKGLQETFPAFSRFPMVSYCTASRRICVGSKNGNMAFYELKQSKAQSIPFQASPTAAMILYIKASSKETVNAHKGAVSAVSFSEDGKYLASYSPVDAKVNFWQTSSSSLFGIGQAHTKCVKTYSVPFRNPGNPQPNVTRGGRLSWVDSRTVSLILADGSESRYKV